MSKPIRKVLIAGGTGFVGEAVREAVRDAGYTVRLLVRSSADARRYEDLGFETEFGDIQDSQSLYVALDGAEAVINLVAIIKESGSATFERVNFQGTANLVSAARQASVNRFIQMSALGAGNLPDYPYHYTKWRAETYVQDHIPAWTIIRPSIIFGPSSEGHIQFVSQLADLIRGGPVIPVPGGGQARFQPIQVDDVAAAIVAALHNSDTEGRILEIAGPEVLTYRQMLDVIADTLKVKKPMIDVPVGLIRLGVKILNPLPLVEAPVTLEQLDMLQIDNTTSQNAINELLGRPPKRFQENLDFLL